MNFKAIKIHFKFTNQQRTGLLLLSLIILVLQAVYFFADFSSTEKTSAEKQQWLSMQSEIDSLKAIKYSDKPKMYLFNPNFITDYKGYKLGMSIQEIDRLLAFRKENKYVNSAKEFQDVTKISDSLLRVISPLFKFPNWTQDKKPLTGNNYKSELQSFSKKEKITVLDINQATQSDLMKIHGIGEALSIRILKQKETLEAFVSMEQLNDVWGLSPEVIDQLNNNFKILAPPKIKKIQINDVSLKQLALFPYFRYTLAKQIVTYRSMNGNIDNIEDLSKIKGFPVEKANIIALYLEF